MTFTDHPPRTNPHLQKLTIDLLFKNNRICKDVTNFKTSLTILCVDIIYVWSLIKGEWSDWRHQKLDILYLSVTFFYLFYKMKYT